MEFTVEQTNLLFEVTEHHMKWYVKFCKEIPKFEDLLEINHLKVKKKFFNMDSDSYGEDDINNVLLELKEKYINMVIGSGK